ncbi:hypothetical protein DAI22_12g111700 [Oryza sativa Japonica Group]|nr:hypothetical protein DAI22_12g111700 [Oryza sativa Japonica Group]
MIQNFLIQRLKSSDVSSRSHPLSSHALRSSRNSRRPTLLADLPSSISHSPGFAPLTAAPCLSTASPPPRSPLLRTHHPPLTATPASQSPPANGSNTRGSWSRRDIDVCDPSSARSNSSRRSAETIETLCMQLNLEEIVDGLGISVIAFCSLFLLLHVRDD